MKKNLLIIIVVLISIFTFGQNTKNTAPELNAANSKSEGIELIQETKANFDTPFDAVKGSDEFFI